MTINCWICRHPNVSQSKDKILIDSIVKEALALQCPICYDIFDSDNLFFTECKHYACHKCTNNIFKKNANNHIRPVSLIPIRPTKVGYFPQYNEYINSIPINLEEYTGQPSTNWRLLRIRGRLDIASATARDIDIREIAAREITAQNYLRIQRYIIDNNNNIYSSMEDLD
jgi:hypothetical protein